MRSVVKGKIINRYYSVECEVDKNEITKIIRKPEIITKKEYTYKDICSFDGDYVINKNKTLWSPYYIDDNEQINISENETVKIEEVIFRADLNEQHIFVDKILEEHEHNKENSENHLKELLKKWNKQEIEKDEVLLTYCNLHKLNIEEINIDELRKIVKSENVSKPIKTRDYYNSFHYIPFPFIEKNKKKD